VGNEVPVACIDVAVGKAVAFTPQAERARLADVAPANFRKSLRDIFLFIIFLCYARNCPTVCVTCVWAGVDSLWEQDKLEARKMLENAAESHTSGARFVRQPAC
jgi:hypothetical protein